jgi:hypothetical protein
MGTDRIFLQCGDAAPGSRGEPDAADWKFAVVSAGGAQRRTLLPRTRERAVEYAIGLDGQRNPGRSQGATAEKANAVPERCPSILGWGADRNQITSPVPPAAGAGKFGLLFLPGVAWDGPC